MVTMDERPHLMRVYSAGSATEQIQYEVYSAMNGKCRDHAIYFHV